MSHSFVLWLISSVLVAIACALFVASLYAPFYRSLLENLGASAVGVLVIVLLVDMIIILTDRKRTRPAQYAAYQEARTLLFRFHYLWLTMARHALSDAPPSGTNLLSDEIAHEIAVHLNLDAPAPIQPKRNWRSYLAWEGRELRENIDRCLRRYSAYMSPALIDVLQRIDGSSFLTYIKLLETIGRVNANLTRKSPNVLQWGANGTGRNDLEAFKELHRILEGESREFKCISGFHPPPDMSFEKGIKAMESARDLGASRV